MITADDIKSWDINDAHLNKYLGELYNEVSSDFIHALIDLASELKDALDIVEDELAETNAQLDSAMDKLDSIKGFL
jgi:hypothetical protein|nr:MAG TPA: hypothetical protein [Caudoviricetes sp.]